MGRKINITKPQLMIAIKYAHNLKELGNLLSCSKDTARYSLIEYGLHEEFIKKNNLPYRVPDVQPCCICGSTFRISKIKGNYYCKKHTSQLMRGGIKKKTIYDKNDYIFEKDICKIVLRNKNQNIVGECIVDTYNYKKVSEYKWFLNKDGYCVTKGIDSSNNISIHNIILDIPPKFYGDHINNNRLDNRRNNLRCVTAQENCFNMSIKNTNTSGVTGISIYKRDNQLKWTATITVDYTPIYLGRSISFDEAIKMRILGEAKYFKKYSNNYNHKNNCIEIFYISKDTGLEQFVYIDLQNPIEVKYK